MDDQRKRPPYLIALLAAMGLLSLPQAVKMQQGATQTAAAEKNAAKAPRTPADADEPPGQNPHCRDLKPLLEYLADGMTACSSDEKLSSYLNQHSIPGNDQALASDPSVHCLVVSLPNPVESAASGRFDEYLDVLQRAIEQQGFVLDRIALPWKAASGEAEAPKIPNSAGKLRAGLELKLGLDIKVETESPAQPPDDRPGLIVFRDAFPPRDNPTKRVALMLVFIVPESPVSGLNKSALVRSLDLIDRYFRGDLTEERKQSQSETIRRPTGRKVLHLLTPCFNGSQSSLEIAIRAWATSPSRNQIYHFRVISNGANQIDAKRLKRLFRFVGFDLRVLEAKGVAEITLPTTLPQIIVTTVGRELHFRVFGADGQKLVDVDTAADALKAQREKVEELRRQLAKRPRDRELSPDEKAPIIATVESIVSRFQHELSFHSMVHQAMTVSDKLIEYLSSNLDYKRSDLAILIESNTGLSQALFQRKLDNRSTGVDSARTATI